ncbi:uncharacterized protein LOC108466352 [Gossypium arboreum]|uniref:uncharacterized protein LOC108466352 n=1 Tax=Gossypium arboreum TaxID=29729 RepID=UPI000818FD0C|nr:uncharacterized protein LOC108466352 [Gossypium arboreum]
MPRQGEDNASNNQVKIPEPSEKHTASKKDKKLGIRKARLTTVALQLADRSYTQTEECEADHDVPIILRRPFLSIGRTLINVQKDELTMTVNNKHVTFNMFDALQYTDENELCHTIDLIETTMDEFAKFCYSISDSEDILMEHGYIVCFEKFGKFESLDLSDQSCKPPKPSIEESLVLELKPLPQHLKYTYLGNESIFPVVISTKLTPEQEDRLNKETRKDRFPLPFIDQMLDRLAGKAFYCFLDGYSPYNQISIALEDQEKTTFTCPYGTFAFRRMSFGLCNTLTISSAA